MSEQIKEQIEFLVQLQETDITISNIRKKINNIPVRLEELDERLTAFKQVVEKETENIEYLKKQYQQYDSDIAANESKIHKSLEKLGSVKNNKEYQATLKEIDDIKEKNSQIEDKMIECLDLIEEAEQQFGSKQDDLSALSREIEAEKKRIEKDREEDGKKLAVLENKKNEITGKIDPKIMRSFEKTRNIVGLVTITKVENAVCLGCHMNIPPQKYNEIQRCDSIHFCPNCHRIIYWKNENERSE